MQNEFSDSMQTFVWGPCGWTYLHMWSKSFPMNPTFKKKVEFAQTFLSFLKTLPCNLCVNNSTKNLINVGFKKPHTVERFAKSKFLKNRHTFTKFMFDFHNQVSLMLGKDISHINYDQVMHDLEIGRAKSCKQTSSNIESGCVQPQYKACKTQIYIVPRLLEGGTKKENNLNIDKELC